VLFNFKKNDSATNDSVTKPSSPYNSIQNHFAKARTLNARKKYAALIFPDLACG
jgi:hypothetical protein